MNDHQGCANALWRAWQNIEKLLADNTALRQENEALRQEIAKRDEKQPDGPRLVKKEENDAPGAS